MFGGDPERIRTSDLQIRNLPLYPAELRGQTGNLPEGENTGKRRWSFVPHRVRLALAGLMP
jgi:hypothetical protein